MVESAAWSELLFLMVHGPDRPMRGRIRRVDGEAVRYISYGHAEGEPEPVFAGGSGDAVDAWCWGDRLRVQDPDGQVRLISDGAATWTFLEPGEPPRESPRRNVEFVLSGTELLVRTTAERWLGDDFTIPTGPPVATTFLGRAAWAVELAPPERKPAPLQIVVDAETGMILQQRNDAFGTVSEWTALTVGEDLDPALFAWSGPAVSWEDQRAASRREHDAEQERLTRWAEDNLGTATLSVTIDAAIEVHWRGDDGSFHGSLASVGDLFRRPRSDDPWAEAERAERWSDERWDWAIQTWESPLTPGALAAVKAQLAGAD